jgi:tryptophan synthase alpha chain
MSVEVPKKRMTLEATFTQDKKLLSIYATAGYPRLEDTMPTLEALQASGVDMIELGMPFSDPLADGPIIQKSSMQAIQNGMNLKVLFEQIQDLRASVHVPVLLMGYMNSVLQFGVEKFCQKCAEIGIDGVILPDLPYYEYDTMYKVMFDQYGLTNVFLITPQTSEERVRILDKATTGFLYLVSTASTTGSDKGIFGAKEYLERIEAMGLKSKKVVGFNVKDKASFDFATNYANGAIIGSAFVRHMQTADDISSSVEEFVTQIRG